MMEPGALHVLWQLDGAAFVACVLLLAWTWVGYPLVVAVVAHWYPWVPRVLAPEAPAGAWPRLTVVVAAHNEAAYIDGRIENLKQQDYPGWYEILISEDGSSDDTAARVRAWTVGVAGRAPVRLLSVERRAGKSAALNRAVQAAQGEVVVFTDANNRFAPQALARLAAPFADSRVGAVVGRKGVEAQAGVGGGESVYWRYEGWLTGQESASGCAAGFYGEALALRRRAYQPLPAAQMVNDDLWLGLAAMARGWRVVAAPEAHSIELGSAHARAEWERRRRMAVGHWAALAVLRRRWQRLGLANAAKLVCHQILRPLSALWLLLALASGLLVLVAPAGAVDGGVRA
ncbi:MAG: glycosyltransferase, partial [Terriglobales bacterium]